jgi:hypothetical protein
MNVPRGTNIRAAVLAGRLLESDMEFYNKLTPADDTLELYGCDQPNLLDAEAFGQMEVWWSVEIEARTWGIKEITPYVKKLVLDGWYEVPDAEGDMQQADTGFHYEYPESEPTPKNIGPDVDAPTPANVVRLATPKWTIDYKIDRYRERSSMTIWPQAEVDLRKRTIEIKF